MRAIRRFSVASAIALLTFLSMAPATFAHPMGNFSINHYSKIIPGAHTIEVDYIIDLAEIPTFQQMQESAFVPKADDPSLVPYLQRESEVLKDGLTLLVDGKSLTLQTVSRQVIFPAGAGGLPTMKMGFVYVASLPSKLTDSPALLRYRDNNYPGRTGWKEIVAVNGFGASLVNASVPVNDRSLELTNYPTDMLHSPPQTLEASLYFKSAPGIQAGNQSKLQADSGWLKTGGAISSGSIVLKANSQGTPRSAFTDLISSKRSDVLFMAMAALVAAVLGGFHALEPGHGKTLVAAYLVGSHGKARHAVLLGAIVTGAHTISVYALGLITLYASHWILPERLYPWLGIGSGLLVAGLGFTLFIRRYLASEPHAADRHVHDRAHSHRHSFEHTHHHARADVAAQPHRHNWWGGHVREIDTHSHGNVIVNEHDHGEGHDHSHGYEHEMPRADQALSLSGLLALGITGGIVPCPAALVVLLGALAFHRVAFGLFLIVAFSAGLAAVLISLGLGIVYAGRFMSRFGAPGPLTQRWLPLASSAVITVIGITLTLQSLVTVGVLRIGT
jgi:ABC-type nickel/cobalt efflux system permease component RcnA